MWLSSVIFYVQRHYETLRKTCQDPRGILGDNINNKIAWYMDPSKCVRPFISSRPQTSSEDPSSVLITTYVIKVIYHTRDCRDQ